MSFSKGIVYDDFKINPELFCFAIRERPELQHREELESDRLHYIGRYGWFSKRPEIIEYLGKAVATTIKEQYDQLSPHIYLPDIFEAMSSVKHGPRQLNVLTIVGEIDAGINPIPHYNLIVASTNIVLENQGYDYRLKS